jgi:hypothetical protein
MILHVYRRTHEASQGSRLSDSGSDRRRRRRRSATACLTEPLRARPGAVTTNVLPKPVPPLQSAESTELLDALGRVELMEARRCQNDGQRERSAALRALVWTVRHWPMTRAAQGREAIQSVEDLACDGIFDTDAEPLHPYGKEPAGAR